MKIDKQELLTVLREYNPWWNTEVVPDIPKWKRAVFSELKGWIFKPPAHRAVILSGARQVGKTTLFLQLIQSLIDNGMNPGSILYVTFDHPLFKLSKIDDIIELWGEIQTINEGRVYLFLDEIQNTDNWQTWLKHQVDFRKNRTVAVTGSAVPLTTEKVESGVGRWYTIKLSTLSFFEYLQIKQVKIPNIPRFQSLAETFELKETKCFEISDVARPLVSYFHEYLLRGGFPQTALVERIPLAQKLLREDIVDKVLKRDMTAMYGVRNILDLEKTFYYLCMNDGGIVNQAKLSKNLELAQQTVSKFINLLEAANLLYKLRPLGYGKEVLRGRNKLYLADPAIAGSVLLKGKSLLDDEPKLGATVETAFFKHLFTKYYQDAIDFSYWRSRSNKEVDIIAKIEGTAVPFEVKYKHRQIAQRDIRGLKEFCEEHKVARAYVITRNIKDFKKMKISQSTEGIKIPAALACFWLSQFEQSG